MVLVCGSCHPTGEEEDYDGLYLKKDEMPPFARELKGKPIYLEHDTSTQVGLINHAWVSDSSDLHVLFETDDTQFPGHLAANVIKKGVAAELSLGHSARIAHSANGAMQVVGKKANEVSIVVKGARDNTRIHAWGHNPKKRRALDLPEGGDTRVTSSTGYILREEGASVTLAMSDSDTPPTESAPAPDAPQQEAPASI